MVRVAVLDKVTDFLIFLGKLVVTGSVTLLSFFYFCFSFCKSTKSALMADILSSMEPVASSVEMLKSKSQNVVVGKGLKTV